MPLLQSGNDAPPLRCPTKVVPIGMFLLLCVLLLLLLLLLLLFGSRGGGGQFRGVGMRKTEVVSHRGRRGRDSRNGTCCTGSSRRQCGRRGSISIEAPVPLLPLLALQELVVCLEEKLVLLPLGLRK